MVKSMRSISQILHRLALCAATIPVVAACASASPATVVTPDVVSSPVQAWPDTPAWAPVTSPTPMLTLAPATPTPTYDPGAAARIVEAGDKNFDAGNWIGAINDYSLAILADPTYAEAY